MGETQQGGVLRARTAEYRDLYSNGSFVRITPFDITITFSMSKEVPGVGNVNEDQVSVTFSPQQFKVLASATANAINAYENTFGKLALPPEFAAPTLSAEQVTSLLQDMSEAVKRNTPSNNQKIMDDAAARIAQLSGSARITFSETPASEPLQPAKRTRNTRQK